MRQRLRAISRHQKGFTLIEVMVATALTGIIGAGIAMAVYHVTNVSAQSTNHVIAVKQVENTIYWINRDGRMAQTIQPGGGSGFPLSLSWVEWDNTTHQVSYTLQNSILQRSHSINGTQPAQMVVAQYINSNADNTSAQYSTGMLTLKVTASVGGYGPASETRTAQVIPRSAQ